MKDELRVIALSALILLVMYCVGEAIVETVKAIVSAFSS